MSDLKALKQKVDAVAIIGSRIELRSQGSHYVACCPFHNEDTPSFKLDDRQGEWLWKCFGCNVGGDVIEFLKKFDHVDAKGAIEKLEAYAGNAEWREQAEAVKKNFRPLTESANKPKTVFTLAQYAPRQKALRDCPAAMHYLKEVRGLDDETIERMGFGYVQNNDKYAVKAGCEHTREAGWIILPRIEGDKVLGLKLRSLIEKVFSQVPNMDSKVLFNGDAANPLGPVYLTEGEFDAATLEMLGFNACSLASGTGSVDIRTDDRIKLKTAERVFLAGDTDEKGKEAMQKLAREFGSNTHVIAWPEGVKDANQFFLEYCNRDKDLAKQKLIELSKEAKDRPPEGFVSLITALRASDGTDLASDPNRLHWPPQLSQTDKMTYTPRGGVVVIYSTYSGTGKSMLKSQLLLWEAKRGEVVADLSPEIRDGEYLALVTSQTVGPSLRGGLPRTGKMDRIHFLEAAKRLDQTTMKGTDFNYYVGHNVIGQSEEEVLTFLESTIKTLGVTRFAIDTFHRLIFAENKNQTQAEGTMVKKLEALGNKYGTIFILICQSNAEAEGIDNLKRNDHGVLRGSREIRDVPASIYLLHRNRRPQKDGENPEDILEMEAGLFAKKTRFKGPGFPQSKLKLQQENSLFVEQDAATQSGDPGPASQEAYPDIPVDQMSEAY